MDRSQEERPQVPAILSPKKKGATPADSAQINRILSKTTYFPFFGPLASSFFPFFFIAMLLSSAAPKRRSHSHFPGYDRRSPPCHLAMYASAKRDCQENSTREPKVFLIE
jgi:hypothetical protein